MSVKFVTEMVKRNRATGALKPKPQGNDGWSKLGPYDDWARVERESDLTQEGLAQALYAEHAVRVAVSCVGYWLHRPGLTQK